MAEGALKFLEARFHQGWLLLLLGLVPAALLGWLWIQRRRQQALRKLSGGHVQALSGARRRWLRLGCWVLGLGLVSVGSAGPLWGWDPSIPPSLGRDLVVVLDVSRSMLAEDRPPESRLVRAKANLEELTDSLQQRGGYRLGLVIFAGQAKVLCPLTEDYDHFRFALELAHPDRLGYAGRLGYTEEGDSYGTSFREALKVATTVHDPRFQGYQEILLVSDGDDLAGDWQQGAAVAGAAGIPVHVLGVGDPAQDAFIPSGRSEEPYQLFAPTSEDLPEKVTTRRRDRVLERIAALTGGSYHGEESAPHPLLGWFQTYLSGLPARPWGEDQQPLRLHQFRWFFAGAVLLFVVEFLLTEQVRIKQSK
jgi:Ca-activated chloride channel family protein